MYEEFVKRLRQLADEQVFDFERAPFQKAADVIEKLIAVCKKQEIDLVELTGELAGKPRWIPVTERLPEEMDRSCGGWSAEIRPSDDVLVWLSSEKRQSVAWYSHTYNEWTTVDENTVYCFGEVTHWMPLPEPPKEG